MSDRDETQESEDFNESLHDSQNETSSNEYIVEESENSDEEIIIAPRKNRRAPVLRDSESEQSANEVEGSDDMQKKLSDESVAEDSDYDEEQEDERAISPRTRMSITGVRPKDLSDNSSSEIDSGSDDSVEEIESDSSTKQNSFINESTEDTKCKDKTETNMTARRSNNKTSESEHESTSNESKENVSLEIDNEKTDLPNATLAVPPRYSSCFAKNINNKLSSTIVAENVNHISFIEEERESEDKSSHDSEIEIICSKNETIEIFSSDEEDVK